MFTSLASGQRIWLVGLLIVWAIFLFGGFIFGSGERRMPTWTRMVSSAVLVIAAWSWYIINRDTFSLLLALGMMLGFVGDLWLAGVLGNGRTIIGGIVAFGIGHIFYISAILTFGNAHSMGVRWGALVGWLLVGLVGWYFVVFRGQEVTVLHWAALPYALLLASTAGFATGLALQSSHFVPLALGAALFLLSDLILAGELFSGLKFPLIGDAIWLTYGPGQALIVYAASVVHYFSNS
jgi:hypothetical protein